MVCHEVFDLLLLFLREVVIGGSGIGKLGGSHIRQALTILKPRIAINNNVVHAHLCGATGALRRQYVSKKKRMSSTSSVEGRIDVEELVGLLHD